MSSWLDPETKALLEETPPKRLAPPGIAGFTLVVLEVWRREPERIARALRRINAKSDRITASHLQQKVPIAVRQGLSHVEALLGQFELISCDVISVFIPDDVIENGDQAYLSDLYATLSNSDEFAKSVVCFENIPQNPRTNEFIEQFLGDRVNLRDTIIVPYKKARIMDHWIRKIGGSISVTLPDDAT